MAQRAVLIGLCASAALAAGAWWFASGSHEGQAAVPVVMASGPSAPDRPSDAELALAPLPEEHDEPAEAIPVAPDFELAAASEREVVDAMPRARVILRGQLSGARGLGAGFQLYAWPVYAESEGSRRDGTVFEYSDDPWSSRLAAPSLAPTPFPSNPELPRSGPPTYSPKFQGADSLAPDAREDAARRPRSLVSFISLAISARADGTVDADITPLFANHQAIPQQISLRVAHPNFATQDISFPCRTLDGQAFDHAALQRSGELVVPFELTLTPLYTVRGQAALCDGSAEQVHVSAWPLVDGRPRVSSGWTAFAAGSGTFALKLDPDRDYAIVACAEDTAPQTQFVRTEGDLEITLPAFQLERGVSISGRVDLARHSFGGAAWLCAADTASGQMLEVAGTELVWNGVAFERRTCSAQAGPDGSFTLAGLSRGRYSLRLGTTRTWAPADTTFQAYAPSSDIVLAPPLVHVTLKLELDHGPLAEHELRVHGVGECAARATPVLKSDALGRAELWLLPGEQYMVEVPMSERDTRSYGKIVPWNRGEVVELVSMSSH